ncbi:uncharacterized protein [Henckelia pumila]|uniref:uncharacterized protein n=1 Tax=Henckelia pumila TaxID=405737 RepID=UPI003C6E8332
MEDSNRANFISMTNVSSNDASELTSCNLENTRPGQRRSSSNEAHEVYLARRCARYQRRQTELIGMTNETITNNSTTNHIQAPDGERDDATSYSVRQTSTLRPITYNPCSSTFESGDTSTMHIPPAQPAADTDK